MRIYILDDEAEIRTSLRYILEDEGYEVEEFSEGRSLLKNLKLERPNLLLLDLWLNKEDGLDLIDECKKIYPTLPIVMISGHGTIEMAVVATKKGAIDFLEKPLSIEKVLNTIKKNLPTVEENNYKEFHLKEDCIIGDSNLIKKLKYSIFQAANTNSRVFILGENGTGKELVAQTIFKNSKRKNKPFIELNCAALPEDLIEYELFGYVKGAFLGAKEDKIGKFEIANTGTLFLDEISDMSLNVQAKLLRVLEENRFQKLGSNQNIELDVRILSATNSPIEELIKEGKFREDLFYRLNVLPIFVPPLRERISDIPMLVDEFLTKTIKENKLKNKTISIEAIEILKKHLWPGNVRELKNVIERVVVLTTKDNISKEEIQESLTGFTIANEFVARGDLKKAKEEFEKEFIKKILMENKGNVTKSSKELGIERSHLYRKIKSLGIQMESLND